MSDQEWLSATDLQHLRASGAPLRYIRALGDLDHPPHALKRFDFSQRYGVFVHMHQRRSLKGAQAATFKIAETLDFRLGERRSVWQFNGPNFKTLAFEWRCVPGWTISISAERYTYDYDWCDVALLIHRRFPDAKSQVEMAESVNVALWGPNREAWPSDEPYSGPVLTYRAEPSQRHPLASLFDDLGQVEPESQKAGAVVEPGSAKAGSAVPSLDPPFIYD